MTEFTKKKATIPSFKDKKLKHEKITMMKDVLGLSTQNAEP